MDTPRSRCTSRRGAPKKRWATEAAARFVAEWARTQQGKDLDVYSCDTCGGWHTCTNREDEQRAG